MPSKVLRMTPQAGRAHSRKVRIPQSTRTEKERRLAEGGKHGRAPPEIHHGEPATVITRKRSAAKMNRRLRKKRR